MIKSIKKVVVVGLTAAMTMSLLTSCGTKKSGSGEKYKIGVIQLTEHVALDQANKGFCDRLEELGIEAEIDQKNAQGEQSTCATIASKFVNDNKDMVLAIATPAAQAIAGATTDIPIVVTAVTDPADSGLVDSNEKPGTNVTGTSDLTPVKQQMELLVKLLPEAKTVGILYCSAEDNSKFQADIAKKEIANLGLNSKEYTVSNMIKNLEDTLEMLKNNYNYNQFILVGCSMVSYHVNYYLDAVAVSSFAKLFELISGTQITVFSYREAEGLIEPIPGACADRGLYR